MEWSKVIITFLQVAIPIIWGVFYIRGQKIDQKVDKSEFDDFKKECKQDAEKRESQTRELVNEIKQEFRENLKDYKENLKETEVRLIERIDLKLSPLLDALKEANKK